VLRAGSLSREVIVCNGPHIVESAVVKSLSYFHKNFFADRAAE